MLTEKLKSVLTFNGVALIIGIIGSLASILTVFITQWNSQISLKWFVFLLFVSVSIILILIKLTFSLQDEIRMKKPHSASVVRYLPNGRIFLTKNNDFLGNSAMVTIFFLEDDYEVELGNGYVNNVQEKLTQIKVLSLTNNFQVNYQEVLQKIEANEIRTLNKIIIKSYVTYAS